LHRLGYCDWLVAGQGPGVQGGHSGLLRPEALMGEAVTAQESGH